MALSKKHTLLILTSIALSAAGYFTYLYFKIVSAYNTVLNQQQATTELQDATQGVSDIDPANYQQDDDEGTSSGTTLGLNRTDAIMLDNSVWLGDSNTGIYNSNNGTGGVYDDNNQVVNYSDGTSSPVSPSEVTYGYFDNDSNEFNAY